MTRRRTDAHMTCRRASDGFLRSRSPPGDWTSCGRGEDGELSRRGSDQYVQWDLTPSSRRSGIGMSKRRVRGGGECARTEGRRDLGSRPPSLRDTGVLRCALTRIRRGAVAVLPGGDPVAVLPGGGHAPPSSVQEIARALRGPASGGHAGRGEGPSSQPAMPPGLPLRPRLSRTFRGGRGTSGNAAAGRDGTTARGVRPQEPGCDSNGRVGTDRGQLTSRTHHMSPYLTLILKSNTIDQI
ncbi:hypothetical protein THAOC_13850 [Thalassiosira oceanica]|uniref:Uncharacterized protein n=1 Tax=Thalassiosira oceanica TaxID=159749 RepID=K0SGM4_THAOC|nr:hypothetical protein THAOC_13850 [Thalassiosira oceanica]|eukprot:EJK65303.1 hypothetical protein THAOC_13850 [Thalassiosira oceanica]